MARIRTIKPDFFKNEDIAELDPILRLLFIGLWTQCDREGKLEDRPKRLKIEIFPYDDFDINYGLNLLHEKGFIVRYNPDEKVEQNSTILAQCNNGARKFIKILTFAKHQQPNVKEAVSSIPNPVFIEAPYEHSASTMLASQEGKGKEQEREQEGNGEEPIPPHELDLNLVNKIMDYFHFTESANYDKMRSIGDFLKCLQINNRIEYFEKEFSAYIEYKTINDSFPHSFKKFLGDHSLLFEDGAWNAEVWTAKLKAEQNKIITRSQPQQASNKGSQAALDTYNRLKRTS